MPGQIVGAKPAGVYPEDDAHVSGEDGYLILGVRSDAGGSLTATDGNRAPLQFDSQGRMRIVGHMARTDALFAKITDGTRENLFDSNNNLFVTLGTGLASTAGGFTSTYYPPVTTATTNGAIVKATPGQFYGYSFFNLGTGWRFLKIFNKASALAIGTDPIAYCIGLPPGQAGHIELTNGIECNAGIAKGVTLLPGVADNTAIPANEVGVSILWL